MKHRCVHANWKERYYHLEGQFRPFKATPRAESSQVATMSTWNNIPLTKDVWVEIDCYGEQVILSGNTILAMAAEIQRIKKAGKLY